MTKGITFNGRHSSEIAGISGVLEYGFPIIPPMRNRTAEITGMNGAADGGKTSEPRPFKIVFLLDGDTIEDYFLKTFEIEQWLNTDEAKPFIYDVLPDRRLMARVTSEINPDRIGSYSRFEVEFTAYKPFFESINENTKTIVQGAVQTYTGSKETPLKIKVTVDAAATFFRVTHAESGKFVLINKAVAAGDVIVIDTGTRKVTQNGADVRANMDVTSRYFKISDDFTLNTNLVSPTIEVTYRERW